MGSVTTTTPRLSPGRELPEGLPAPPTHEEQLALARRARAGDAAARNEMVERNLCMVAAVALRRRPRHMTAGDAFQSGVRGLIRAVERFDPDLGFCFSTFARPWIWQAVQRASAKDYLVAVPHHAHGRARGPRREGEPGYVEDARRAMAAGRFGHRDADGADVARGRPDPGAASAEAEGREAAARLVERALASLPDRERELVRACYGIGRPAVPEREIGPALGLSRSGTNAAKHRALRRMRGVIEGLSAAEGA